MQYTNTFYALTIGDDIRTRQIFEGEIEADPTLFQRTGFWLEALKSLAEKANAVIVVDGSYVHPRSSNEIFSPEEITKATNGRISYGAFKDSLPHKVDVKIIRLRDMQV